MDILRGHSLRRVNHSIRYSVSHLQKTSFLMDILQFVDSLMSAQPTK